MCQLWSRNQIRKTLPMGLRPSQIGMEKDVVNISSSKVNITISWGSVVWSSLDPEALTYDSIAGLSDGMCNE